MTGRVAPTWTAIVFGGLLVACGGSAKREASALDNAVDRYRNASDATRASRTDALNAVSCSDGRVCEAKRTCVEAIQPTSRALALKDEVSLKVAEIEAGRLAPDAPEARALGAKLDEAARLLREGHQKLDECDTKLTDLRATYGY